jgi:hypothetical protein
MALSLETEITSAVAKAQQDIDAPTVWKVVSALGPLLVIGSLPLALVVGAVSITMETLSEGKALKTARMDDGWLEKVSNSRDVSKEGLAYLAKGLSKKGYVSVSEAIHFLELEAKSQKATEAATNRDHALAGEGAASLLDRAQAECGSLLDSEVIKRAYGAIKAKIELTPNTIKLAGRLTRPFKG